MIRRLDNNAANGNARDFFDGDDRTVFYPDGRLNPLDLPRQHEGKNVRIGTEGHAPSLPSPRSNIHLPVHRGAIAERTRKFRYLTREMLPFRGELARFLSNRTHGAVRVHKPSKQIESLFVRCA